MGRGRRLVQLARKTEITPEADDVYISEQFPRAEDEPPLCMGMHPEQKKLPRLGPGKPCGAFPADPHPQPWRHPEFH